MLYNLVILDSESLIVADCWLKGHTAVCVVDSIMQFIDFMEEKKERKCFFNFCLDSPIGAFEPMADAVLANDIEVIGGIVKLIAKEHGIQDVRGLLEDFEQWNEEKEKQNVDNNENHTS